MSELNVLELNPGLILILGALLMPVVPHAIRAGLSLVLPVCALAYLFALPTGAMGVITLFDYNLVTLRVDALSTVFALVFLIAAFLAAVYSLHVKSWVEQTAAQMYAGSAIGAVFAGDLITLFVFWEITAITSVFLIWARQTNRAFDTGMRYLLVQIGSGVILLAGVIMLAQETGSVAFNQIADIDVSALDAVPLYAWLILIGVGIKAAFPLLHAWLPDAYPEATATGTVWLSIFTTKLAIYTLARGFPGSDILVLIGAAMALFTLFYAATENDLRRVLAYALNNQLGFMVVAVGVGSNLAITGVAAQAFCHVLYKSLLFMSMGAVVHRTGTAKATELGGLYRSMPWTTAFCIIGALSISFPLFCGFVSKSLILSSTAKEGYTIAWGILMFASAGVFLTSGLRVPYLAFFATDQGKRPKEAPINMLLAMAGVSIVSVAVGVFPSALFSILPNDISYPSYTAKSVITQMQLLMFTTLAFAGLVALGLYPKARNVILRDADWTYRKLGYHLGATTLLMLGSLWTFISNTAANAVTTAERTIGRTHNPDGILGRSWSTGVMAFVATVMLAAYLLLFYFRDLPV